MVNLVLFITGAFILMWGADWLVKGSASLAHFFRIPMIFIGLTIVSLGTGSPEIVVSGYSSWIGEGALAIGNIVGSNVCNTFLILGLSSLMTPLKIHPQILRKDLFWMIGTTLFALLLGWKGSYTTLDGCLLILIAFVYILLLYRRAKQGKPAVEVAVKASNLGSIIFYTFFGLIGLALGADLLVKSARDIALQFSIPPFVIGATIVAIGTSLPEIATSMTAAKKGSSDLAVGNVIGSNIFNFLIVLGITVLVSPTPIDTPNEIFYLDFPFLLFGAFLYLPIFYSGKVIHWYEGIFLIFLYLGFLGYQMVLYFWQ